MWKLFIKVLGGTEYVHIPNTDISSNVGRGNRGATPIDLRGFNFMSEAVSFMSSSKFVQYINEHMNADVEIVEVQIKFEELS